MSAECEQCGNDLYQDLTCPRCPLVEQIEKLETQVKELREALEPFWVEKIEPIGQSVWCDEQDLKDAQAVLEKCNHE